MDDTILSGDLRLSAHVARAEHAGAQPRAGALPRAPQPAAGRGDRRHDVSRPRRPHRQRGGLGRAHVQLPRHRARPTATSRRAAGSTTCATRCACVHAPRRRARRVGRGLRARRHVRGVRSRRRPPGARGGDDRVAEHAARLGAGSRPPARARAVDGHDPHATGFPTDATAVGARHRSHRRDRRRRAGSTAVRCSCSTASRTPRCRSTTPGRWPTPAARTRSCGWCRAPGHRLRHDPRAIATLLGWLARQVPSGAPVDDPTEAPASS